MARAAKKETPLTTEEKLAKALVPEEEQPYPVPENWCWVRLGTVIESVNEKTDIFDQADLKYVGLENIEKDTGKIEQQPANEIKSTKNVFREGDILYGKLRPYLNKHGIVSFSGVCSTDILVFRAKLLSSNKLVDYFFHLPNFIEYAVANSKGINLPRVSEKIVLQASFPLPPLPEQQRIVTLIESLFADLDAAKDKLQAVLDGFAQRRAALLHQAFTGELTREWREKKGIPAKPWSKRKLGEIGHLERGRSKHRPRNDPKLFGGSYPFIQTGDIAASGMYVTTHKQTLSEVGLQHSRLFPAGTLCITIAANIGDVAILSYDCCFPDSVVGFTPNAKTISEYVYYMMTTLQQELETNAPATAQKNINLKLLNDTYVSVPTIKEQKEIVRILDNILAKESQSKATVESALAKIDTMKKAILATAFRGGFETNNSSDESAKELLRKVL